MNAAGGLVSLMPLDRDDYQQALRESAELKRENAELTDELRRSSAEASKLQSELNNVLADDDDDSGDDDGGGGGGDDDDEKPEGEKSQKDSTRSSKDGSPRGSKGDSPRGSKGDSPRGSKAAEAEHREARLTADLTELQGRLNELQEALTASESQVEKMTSILKESMQAKPMDIHAEMYEKQMAMNAGSSGVDKPFGDRAATEEGGEEGTGEGEATATANTHSAPPRTSADSLKALTHQIKMARNYQLKKGIGEAMQRVGVDNDELQNLAQTYEGQHVDFNQTLEEIVRKV